jgi:electron transfer flavoprotein beta subunit
VEFKIIVLVKQVPDTHNIKGDAMKPDGTVNRAALPAIFNPEDLNALEEAIKLKEKYSAKITVITMGPPNASEVLRESLFRGADEVVLITDRKFAGADTLATSYALSTAIKKLDGCDLILCGRQAIDGDTAQVGPQTAEKLGFNQITCVHKIVEVKNQTITVERNIESGIEVLKTKFPVLITVTNDANTPRPQSAKRVIAYKNAITPLEAESYDEEYLKTAEIDQSNIIIKLWSVADIGAVPEQCGLSGSPTKVKEIESVVLGAKDVKHIENTKAGFETLIKELSGEHIIS